MFQKHFTSKVSIKCLCGFLRLASEKVRQLLRLPIQCTSVKYWELLLHFVYALLPLDLNFVSILSYGVSLAMFVLFCNIIAFASVLLLPETNCFFLQNVLNIHLSFSSCFSESFGTTLCMLRLLLLISRHPMKVGHICELYDLCLYLLSNELSVSIYLSSIICVVRSSLLNKNRT